MRLIRNDLGTVLIGVLLTAICSCTPSSEPQRIDPKTYFPYHIGDTAVYRDMATNGNDSLLIESTISVVVLRGMSYNEVVRFRPASNWRDTSFERVAWNGNLYQFDAYADTEYCVIDFAKLSFIPPTSNEYADVVDGYDLHVTVPAGTFSPCIRTRSGEVEKTSRYFAQDVGMIRSSSWWGDVQLLYANRAGKRFGSK